MQRWDSLFWCKPATLSAALIYTLDLGGDWQVFPPTPPPPASLIPHICTLYNVSVHALFTCIMEAWNYLCVWNSGGFATFSIFDTYACYLITLYSLQFSSKFKAQPSSCKVELLNCYSYEHTVHVRTVVEVLFKLHMMNLWRLHYHAYSILPTSLCCSQMLHFPA